MTETASILLVDDLRYFKRETLLSCEPGTYIKICRSSQSAVETLAAEDRVWDQLWLDHDLGVRNGQDDTTMAVVDYILFRHREGNPLKIASYIIHSANPIGVKNIAMALESIDLKPVITDPKPFFTATEQTLHHGHVTVETA